jgi:5-dehydro-4-deoxyglucarate dehydratase
MNALSPQEVAQHPGAGLLSFPVTPLNHDGAFDEGAYREHISWLAELPASGLFAAGGTGEFFSLTPSEVEQTVAAAVDAAPAGLPVIVPGGYGTATAVELAQAGKRAGAQGILLLAPYLTEASQAGLAAHVRAVCSATDLAVIVYSRANAIYSEETVAQLAEDCPTFVGFKDGVGNIEHMTRIYSRMGDWLTYIGGLPTAAMFALPYLSLRLTTYSSAIFNFVPQFAVDFYNVVRRRDDAAVMTALNEFVIPYCDLRNRESGYAVSIIKAGMKVIGRAAGPVRSPLTDLGDAEIAELADLVKKVS